MIQCGKADSADQGVKQFMHRWLRRNASWNRAVALSLLSILLYWLLWDAAAEFALTEGNPTLPDSAIHVHNLYREAELFSQFAITFYLNLVALLDVAFPVLLFLSLGMLLVLTGARGRWPMVPFWAMVVDYSENIAIQIVLRTLDEPILAIGAWASALTKIKFLLYGLAIIALIYFSFRHWVSSRD